MRRLRRGGAVTLAALLGWVVAGSGNAVHAAPAPPAPIKHVFVIVLENKDYDEAFGPASPAPYLSKSLPARGQLLTQYYGIGHESLDNYVAMISGQAPNPLTQADCNVYQDFAPSPAVLGGNGQAIGQGCVFPDNVATVANQLDAAGLSWRGYMDDMKTPCRHPAIDAQDTTQKAKVGDQYAARHNPFVYFHSIIDDDAACRAKVVDLANLNSDIQSVDTTPNFSFITPNLCHDGHDTPCVDQQPGGLVSADLFLQEWVPKILASPAYQRDGLLLITFDEAEGADAASASACCGEAAGPNSPRPGINGPGGGRVGGVVLSPFTTPGTTNDTPYNHYALLRTIEDLFGLAHLGFAASDGLRPFGPDVFQAAPAAPATTQPSTTTSTAPQRDALARTGGTSWTTWAAATIVLLLLAVRVTTATPKVRRE